MKKLLIITALLILIGCTAQSKTLRSFVDDTLKKNYEDVEKLNNIYLVYDLNDEAHFGVSSVKYSDSDQFFLTGVVNEDQSIGFTQTGTVEPMLIDLNNNTITLIRANENKLCYITISSEDKEYYYGVLFGKYQDITYDSNPIKNKTQKLTYLDKNIDMTVWILELDKDIQIDEKLLNFN